MNIIGNYKQTARNDEEALSKRCFRIDIQTVDIISNIAYHTVCFLLVQSKYCRKYSTIGISHDAERGFEI
jgi:hypothetical protein